MVSWTWDGEYGDCFEKASKDFQHEFPNDSKISGKHVKRSKFPVMEK